MIYLKNDHKTYILEEKYERKELLFPLGSILGNRTTTQEETQDPAFVLQGFNEHCWQLFIHGINIQ